MKYGWKPDTPDSRDQYLISKQAAKKMPKSVDLSSKCPPAYQQGRIGSCTAQAIGGAYQYGLGKQKLRDCMPSRLFIYYNAREMENSVAIDSGAMIRDGIKSLNKLGVCPEKDWPYDDTPADPVTGLWLPNAKPAMKPTTTCYKNALKRRATSYSRVIQEINQLKGCLAEGFPFVFGFAVYESFENDITAKTGIVNMPLKSEAMLGGHAVMAVGYDDNTSRFKVRNSWGANWGQKGYFTIPYSYLIDSNLSDDFWTIRFVTG